MPTGGRRVASVSLVESGGSSQLNLHAGDRGRVQLVRLKRRAEFVAVAATRQRWVTPAFVVQAGPRPAPTTRAVGGAPDPATNPRLDIALLGALDLDGGAPLGEPYRVGFTASRRVGKAVARNRARRRLVAAVRQVLPGTASPGYNYVVVARPAVLTCPFDQLLNDLTEAFAGIGRRLLE